MKTFAKQYSQRASAHWLWEERAQAHRPLNTPRDELKALDLDFSAKELLPLRKKDAQCPSCPAAHSDRAALSPSQTPHTLQAQLGAPRLQASQELGALIGCNEEEPSGGCEGAVINLHLLAVSLTLCKCNVPHFPR